MNKTEIAEIRRQFTPDRCAIEHICMCYVGSEKEKKFTSRDSFLSLPEEEMHKYLAFFKKVLTGDIGKSLMNLDFSNEEELAGQKQGFLLQLRDSELKDEALLDEFYDRVIENYDCADRYCILIVYASYDIPGKTTDEIEMEDASDEVYNYLLCCLCPVTLDKGRLGYDSSKNRIGELRRDWIVEAPDKGFLFPVFNERMPDIHELLYYTKKSEQLQPDFIRALFGSPVPLSAKDQKDTFDAMISEALGDDGDVEMMKNIHDCITELLEDMEDNPEPPSLKAPDVKKILSKSGVSAQNLEFFDDESEEGEADSEIMVSNISGLKKFNISTPDIDIRINPEYLSRVKGRIVDGRQCIVIEVDDHVTVNGISVRTIGSRIVG